MSDPPSPASAYARYDMRRRQKTIVDLMRALTLQMQPKPPIERINSSCVYIHSSSIGDKFTLPGCRSTQASASSHHAYNTLVIDCRDDGGLS